MYATSSDQGQTPRIYLPVLMKYSCSSLLYVPRTRPSLGHILTQSAVCSVGRGGGRWSINISGLVFFFFVLCTLFNSHPIMRESQESWEMCRRRASFSATTANASRGEEQMLIIKGLWYNNSSRAAPVWGRRSFDFPA